MLWTHHIKAYVKGWEEKMSLYIMSLHWLARCHGTRSIKRRSNKPHYHWAAEVSSANAYAWLDNTIGPPGIWRLLIANPVRENRCGGFALTQTLPKSITAEALTAPSSLSCQMLRKLLPRRRTNTLLLTQAIIPRKQRVCVRIRRRIRQRPRRKMSPVQKV